jgi:hypothetical protein
LITTSMPKKPVFERKTVKDLNEYHNCADVGSPAFIRLFHGVREYANSKAWISKIKQFYIGKIVDDRVAVVLLEITPAQKTIDTHLWIVWGDVPSAYLVLDNAKTPEEAIDVYLSEVSRWIDGVLAGAPLPDTMPLDWEETPEAALRLKKLVTEIFKPVQTQL